MANPIAEALQPFIWGRGGARMTPEQIAREREIAEALGVVDTSPVDHWLQGAARMANAAVGRIREGRANRAEQENATFNRDTVAGLLGSLGGGSAIPVAAAISGGAPVTDPASARVAQAHGDFDVRQGLIDRGMSPHIADAFVMNFQDESGLNPGINEANPIVPGSRGGFGLSQWTGPRRRALEAYAADRGLPVDDGNMQLDFLMSELAGPEASAWQAIQAAPDTGSAAAAIVNQFLRPAEQHRAAREARYLRAGGAPSQAVASSLTGSPVNADLPMMGGGGAPMPAAAPAQSPVQVAQAGGINPAIIEALSSPYASDQTRQIAQLLLGQQMQEQQNQQAQQMRMQAAQQAGIDPRFAGDDEIWKAAVGQQFRDPTTDIQEYEYARQQGFPGSFTDFQIAKREAGGVNVNVGDGAPGLGKLSADYGYVMDPETRQPVIDPMTGLPQAAPIPGSPAAQSMEDAERQRKAARTNAANYARTVTQDIGIADEYLGQIEGMAAEDGVIGANLRAQRAGIRGTPENNMKVFVDSALSNVTLDTMNRMRESSPAGATGFGNMSERQMEVIRGVLGNWKPSLPVEDQRMILHRLGNFYLDVQFGSEQERQEAVRDGRMSPVENEAIQELYYPETRDIRGRRINEGRNRTSSGVQWSIE